MGCRQEASPHQSDFPLPPLQPLSLLHRSRDSKQWCLQSPFLERKRIYTKKQELVSRSKTILMLYRPLASFYRTKIITEQNLKIQSPLYIAVCVPLWTDQISARMPGCLILRYTILWKMVYYPKIKRSLQPKLDSILLTGKGLLTEAYFCSQLSYTNSRP